MKMRLSSVLCRSVAIFLFIASSHVNCQTVSYRLPTAIVPAIYELHITIDLDNFTFSGTETIYLHANQPSSAIELHSLDLSIDYVHVIEGENEVPIGTTTYSEETEIFRISLGEGLIAGRDYQLKLSFAGEIKDDMKGLYRSSYYENRVVKYIATTFSAAAYARKIFPCFDEPAFKAEFRLSITNKNNFVTLANTKISSTENDDVWRTTNFEPTPVMSTYLLAFAVTDFRNQTQSDPMEFSVYSSQRATASMQYALDKGQAALQTLEEYVGHNYTLAKMDFIAIDDFLMGAMENWGLVSFKSSRIMNPVGLRNRRKVKEILTIVTHELVHMFFGNEVTCAWWDNVWLNEGFASYLEYVIADKVEPHWRILDHFVVDRMHAVMLQDVKPKTHAMNRPVNTPAEISRIYDFVAYPKAASVIRMMEHIMMPEIFQKSFNLYIHERSLSTATDEQLYDVLERTRRNESDANYPPIPEIFGSWANNPGFPILNVEFFSENGTVKVTQELFVSLINSTESSDFHILYNYASSPSGFGDTSPTNWIHSQAEVRHSLDGLGSDARWVIFNIQQTGYYRVNYDVENWLEIIDELHGESFNLIHVLNRAQLVDDSFNLARYDYLDFNVALSLIKYLHQEIELIPLTAGFKALEFLMTFLDQQDFYMDLRAILLDVVDEVYVRVNNITLPEASDDETHHVLTKLLVNQFACKFGVKTCLSDATRELFLFDHTTSNPPIDARPFLFCGILGEDLAQNHWTQLRAKLMDANGNEEFYRDNQEEFSEIFEAFSTCDTNLVRVERLLNDIFISSNDSYENVSQENAIQVVGNLIKRSSAHRNLVMLFYEENFDVVNQRAPFEKTLPMFAEAINTLAHLERFASLASAAGISVNESVAEIEENIRWIMVKAPEIAKWVVNEKGAGMKLKATTLTVVTFIFVMLLK